MVTALEGPPISVFFFFFFRETPLSSGPAPNTKFFKYLTSFLSPPPASAFLKCPGLACNFGALTVRGECLA